MIIPFIWKWKSWEIALIGLLAWWKVFILSNLTFFKDFALYYIFKADFNSNNYSRFLIFSSFLYPKMKLESVFPVVNQYSSS